MKLILGKENEKMTEVSFLNTVDQFNLLYARCNSRECKDRDNGVDDGLGTPMDITDVEEEDPGILGFTLKCPKCKNQVFIWVGTHWKIPEKAPNG